MRPLFLKRAGPLVALALSLLVAGTEAHATGEYFLVCRVNPADPEQHSSAPFRLYRCPCGGGPCIENEGSTPEGDWSSCRDQAIDTVDDSTCTGDPWECTNS